MDGQSLAQALHEEPLFSLIVLVPSLPLSAINKLLRYHKPGN